MSVNDTDPALLFGGTWEQIQGRFLLAADDTYKAGATGGEATHKLTVTEMPAHNHSLTYMGIYGAGSGTWAGGIASQVSGTANVSSSGGSQPHNNMPPYLAVYMWQRIG